MRPHIIITNLIILTAVAGCAEAIIESETSSCNPACTVAQACINGMCYDTCSQNKPCKAFNATCQNHICIAKDAECTPNTRKCHTDDKTVMICKDGMGYEPEKVCGSNETCDMGVCVENACVDGTKRCRQNNVEICKNSAFTVYTECELPQICQEGSFECEEPAECQGNVKKCDENGNIVACINDHWRPHQTCAAGYACDTTKLECIETATCDAGSLKCNGDTVYQCLQSHWQKLAACKTGELCRQGKCIKATCEDGESRCSESGNLSYIEVCQYSEFYPNTQCMSGEVCVMADGKATCAKNQCSSLYKCENNALYKCELTDYQLKETCTAGTYCDAVSGACLPNCGNNIVDAGEDCDGITFRDGLSCGSAVTNSVGDLKCTKDCKLDASGCTTKCESGAKSCTESVLSECIGGKWQTTDCAASGQACGANGCYTPSFTGEWHYLQDFENLPTTAVQPDRYTAVLEFEENGISWKMQGRRDMDNKNIDGQGLIMRKDSNATCYIHATHIPNGVKKLAFSWRSWGGSGDSGSLFIKVGTVETKLEFSNVTTTQNYELDIDTAAMSSADEIRIESTNKGRIIIDNLRWIGM